MPNQWIDDPFDDDDDLDGQQQGQQPQQLPNEARKHMRKLQKENTDLKAENASLKAAQRKSSVSDIVKAKGYDARLATLIPADVDSSEESVAKWLADHAGLFAMTSTTPDPAADDAPPVDEIPADVMQVLGQITSASAGAITPSKPADLMQKLNDPNLTREGLLQLISANGGKV